MFFLTSQLCAIFFTLDLYQSLFFLITLHRLIKNKHVRHITNKRQNEFCITDFE